MVNKPKKGQILWSLGICNDRVVHGCVEATDRQTRIVIRLANGGDSHMCLIGDNNSFFLTRREAIKSLLSVKQRKMKAIQCDIDKLKAEMSENAVKDVVLKGVDICQTIA
jgi:hypothetical protein